MASLERAQADIAAGDFDLIEPGMLRREFEAILNGDQTGEDLDGLIGNCPCESP